MRITDEAARAYVSGRTSARQIGAAGLRVLQLELRPLLALSTCDVVAEQVGALTADVSAGHTSSALDRLRAWSSRWSRVRPDIRAFYEREDVHQTRAGMWGLRRILDGDGTASGPLRGELDRLWSEVHGSKPVFSLIPKIDIE